MSELNEFGREVFDQTPIDYPIKFDRPTPLHIRLREQILRVMSDMRGSTEMDTPDEADDFTPDDDKEFWENSPYEGDFDHINDSKFTEPEKQTEPASQESSPDANGSEPSNDKA